MIIAAGVLVAFVWREDPGHRLRPDDVTILARGRIVYTEQCAACHGLNLEGQPNWRERKSDGRLPAPPHDETGHTWHHADEILFDIVKRGPAAVVGMDYATDMPAYEATLTDDEIVAVLSYIKSTWRSEVRARHDKRGATQGAGG